MARDIERDSFTEADYSAFAQKLTVGLGALKSVLARPDFGKGAITLGAELELCIIDQAGCALPINRAVLARNLDPHLTLEIDRFNLEYNLTPVLARGRPFSAMAQELSSALSRLDDVARVFGGRVVPIGILPTLTQQELEHSALTDLPRYRALSAGLRRARHAPFEIRIDGEDPLSITCPDITLEGANTSFQVHLRVPPDEFADTYNAVQLATPLALAVGANSPLFLGHRLWDETRVALFKQSLDVREADGQAWRAPARVAFGYGWAREGAWEHFAEAVALFPPILPAVGDEDAARVVAKGEIPVLRELRTHQSTVWRWNRAVYDDDEGGHLRIEMRALPAGPTPIDMAANAAFLVGLAYGWRDQIRDLVPQLPFAYAEWNFYRAAQKGLDANILWFGPQGGSPRERSVRAVAEESLDVAASGLARLGVEREESDRLLGVIHDRLQQGVTGARWQRAILSELVRRMPRHEALRRLVNAYVVSSRSEAPVHTWGLG